MSLTATFFATFSLFAGLPDASTEHHGPIHCPDCNDMNRQLPLPETEEDLTPATCRVRLYQEQHQLKAAVLINGIVTESATFEIEQNGRRWVEYLDLRLPGLTVGLPSAFNALAPRVFRVVFTTGPQSDRIITCPEL